MKGIRNDTNLDTSSLEANIERDERRERPNARILLRVLPFFLYAYADAVAKGDERRRVKAFAVTAARQRLRDKGCPNVRTASVYHERSSVHRSNRGPIPTGESNCHAYNFQFDSPRLILDINPPNFLHRPLPPPSMSEFHEREVASNWRANSSRLCRSSIDFFL